MQRQKSREFTEGKLAQTQVPGKEGNEWVRIIVGKCGLEYIWRNGILQVSSKVFELYT